MSDESEIQLKVATVEINKLEHRVTHLLEHIETLEVKLIQQNEYADRIVDVLNEVMVDVTGLYDSFDIANKLLLDIIANPNKLRSVGEIAMSDNVIIHLDWIMDTLKQCLDKHHKV